jgi:PEP-CTERM motif
MFKLRCLVALFIGIVVQSHGSVLQDAFDGNSLDVSKWNTILPYSDSVVSVQDGFLRTISRGTVVTQSDFIGQTSGPIMISGSFRLANAYSVFEVWLRSDGILIPGNSNGWVGGIMVGFWSGPNYWSSPGLKIGYSDLTPNIFTDSITFNPDQVYNFKITDGGSWISVDVDGVNRVSSLTQFSTGGKVVLNGRQNRDGQVGQVDVFGLQIVPEPSSLSLLALGGLALAINKRRRSRD